MSSMKRWNRSPAAYQRTECAIQLAMWLLERVPAHQHADLGDRLPMVRLLLAAKEQRRPITPEWVGRMLECSRATAYRVLAGMKAVGVPTAPVRQSTAHGTVPKSAPFPKPLICEEKQRGCGSGDAGATPLRSEPHGGNGAGLGTLSISAGSEA